MKKPCAGFALVFVLSFIVIVGILFLTTHFVGISTIRLSHEEAQIAQADMAARSALEQAYYDLWLSPVRRFLAQHPEKYPAGTFVSTKDLRQILSTSPFNLHGMECHFGIWICGAGHRCKAKFTTEQKDFSYKLIVTRRDSIGGLTWLDLDATGYAGKAVRHLQQTLTIRPQYDPENEFALLANNLGPALSNMQIGPSEAAYMRQLKGAPRIRVASLEGLTLFGSFLSSRIMGTLYTRGQILDEGNNLSNGSITTVDFLQKRGFRTNRLSGETKILAKQDCFAKHCGSFAHFYTHYPKDDFPDGWMPNRFPAAIKGIASEPLISHARWKAAVKAETDQGSLTGGTIEFLPTQQIRQPQKRDEQLIFIDKLESKQSFFQPIHKLDPVISSDRGVSGSLFLTGSLENPLRIDDALYVDGDIFITGRIRGNGRLFARRNIYILGNLQYWCDKDKKEKTCELDSPDDSPKLGLLAGENLIIGPFWGKNKDIDFFNDQEHKKSHSDKTYFPYYYQILDNVLNDQQDETSPSHNEIILSLEPIAFKSELLIDRMKTEWIKSIQTASFSRTELKIDGLLYAHHGIFEMSLSEIPAYSNVQFYGALIAADISLISRNKIFYDERVSHLLRTTNPPALPIRENIHQVR